MINHWLEMKEASDRKRKRLEVMSGFGWQMSGYWQCLSKEEKELFKKEERELSKAKKATDDQFFGYRAGYWMDKAKEERKRNELQAGQ